MHIAGLLITPALIACLFSALSAGAKTLIYTHADLRYDEAAVAGPAARTLFEDESFKNKILLITEGGEDRYTFDPEGLQFSKEFSRAGELVWNDSDSKITIGGGYFDACFYTTLWQVILQSRRDLEIRVAMDAVYGHVSYFAFDDDDLANELNSRGLYFGPPRTLSQAEAALKQIGRPKEFVAGLRKYLEGMDRKELRNANVKLSLRGKPIAEFGRGRTRKVLIDFR